MNKTLANKINRMAKVDQEYRRKISMGAKWNHHIDKKNTSEMKKIVVDFGWPTIQLVGKEASHNAWLLVQHADLDHEFQQKVLKIMKTIEMKVPGSVELSNIAYLTDRLLVAKDKKQEFGTQFFASEKTDCKYQVRPCRDMKNLDKRRKRYGLQPFKQYAKKFNKKNVVK